VAEEQRGSPAHGELFDEAASIGLDDRCGQRLLEPMPMWVARSEGLEPPTF
jgi:hypothetical protein